MFDAEITISPIWDSGRQVTHFVSVMKDMTERKKAMARKPQSEISYEFDTMNRVSGIEDYHFYSVGSYNETKEGLDELLGELVRVLDLIRVFTKEPHREIDTGQPFVVLRGSTVEDVARHIHKELAEHLKLVRAWGTRFHDGQPVGRDLVLEDGDVLEFHEQPS